MIAKKRKGLQFIMFFLMISAVIFWGKGTVNVQAAGKNTPARPQIIRNYYDYSASRYVIRWSKVKKTSGYEIYQRNAGKKWKKVKTVKGSKKVTYTFKLKTGQKADFRIRAYRLQGKKKIYSKFSNVKRIIGVKHSGKEKTSTDSSFVLPTPIVDLSENGQKLEVILDLLKGAAGYEVYRQKNSESWRLYDDIAVTPEDEYTIIFSDKEMTPEPASYTNYSYKFRAYKIQKGKKIYTPFTGVGTVTIPQSEVSHKYKISFMVPELLNSFDLFKNMYPIPGNEMAFYTKNPCCIEVDGPLDKTINGITFYGVDENGNKSRALRIASEWYDEWPEEGKDNPTELGYQYRGKYYGGMVFLGISGNIKVYVQESHVAEGAPRAVLEKYLGTVHVSDTSARHEEVMNAVIAASTSSDMTPQEKLKAVCGYLRNVSKYPMCYSSGPENKPGYLYINSFESFGRPIWLTNIYNSYTSPAEISRYAKKLGVSGENLYGKYPEGSAEWMKYHSYFLGDDGTYYSFCPPTRTMEGVYNSTQMPKIDMNSITYYSSIGGN